MITHMFNAMQSFHHRDPGLVGVLGSDPKEETPGVYYGIICDEIHCHPASVRIAYNASPKKVVLVTDAMMAMGLPPGQYPLGTMTVPRRTNPNRPRLTELGPHSLMCCSGGYHRSRVYSRNRHLGWRNCTDGCVHAQFYEIHWLLRGGGPRGCFVAPCRSRRGGTSERHARGWI